MGTWFLRSQLMHWIQYFTFRYKDVLPFYSGSLHRNQSSEFWDAALVSVLACWQFYINPSECWWFPQNPGKDDGIDANLKLHWYAKLTKSTETWKRIQMHWPWDIPSIIQWEPNLSIYYKEFNQSITIWSLHHGYMPAKATVIFSSPGHWIQH